MANQEHLDILGQGVQTWNQWGQKHPAEIPDLQGAAFRVCEVVWLFRTSRARPLS